MDNKKRKIAVLAGALGIAVTVGLTGCAESVSSSMDAEAAKTTIAANAAASGTEVAEDSQELKTIVISSREAEMGTPDLATISFGISNQAKKPEDAQNENSELTDKVIAALKDKSIDDSDIQTTSYNLYPQYNYNSGSDRITGYQVQTTLSVKNQSVDDVGEIISAAVGAGANNVSDIQYSCSQYDELYESALQKAISSSKEKAQAAATAAGKTLGDVVKIEEASQNDYYRNYSATSASMDMTAAEDAGSVDIMPGEVEITAQVSVTYAME